MKGLRWQLIEDVLARDASEVTAGLYPDRLRLGDLQLPLTYHFEPGHVRDGVTVTSDSKIVTLSTCIKNKPNNRYLIFGVLVN